MEGPLVIGLDAGGTKLLGGVVGPDLRVHHRTHRRWRGEDTGEVLDVLIDAVEELQAAEPSVARVGLGIPSLVDFAAGRSVSSVHLPLDGVPVRDLMSERLGLAVAVDNDANLAALAEQRHGAAKGSAFVVALTLGTGIGGGIVLDGRVYRGLSGAAGELGHMVIDKDGPPCQGNCPNRGCLEAFASGPAIGRAGEEAARRVPDSELGAALGRGREITGALVTELAHDGDAAAREVMHVAGEHLGVGIANIANALNPEVVVVGGGVVAAGDLLLGPARRELARRALAPSRDQVRVEAAHFADEAGMIGAALMALEDAS
ncbi:MAG TPA: ROK family protein [Thermoleophilaceae bacterium]|nr:ROK family protein [Thermoleophilaceae bacterium]